MNQITASDKIGIALEWVAARHPIMVAVALSDWRIIADESVGTASTDGHSLRYAPSFFEMQTIGIAKCIVLHEAAHCLRGHPARVSRRSSCRASARSSWVHLSRAPHAFATAIRIEMEACVVVNKPTEKQTPSEFLCLKSVLNATAAINP
jgi:hypothetical protein